MNKEAERVIEALSLIPLPMEGGFFRRTWTSTETLPSGRSAGSAIYFLLGRCDFSALHRLKTDEVWHFHAGDPVDHVQWKAGQSTAIVHQMGSDLWSAQIPQVVVPGGHWQGARPSYRISTRRHGWSLFSCTMSPAWDETEFELGLREPLLSEFPQQRDWIVSLTR